MCAQIEVLGPAGDLPLPVFGDQPYPEDTRLRYRFLDLRREKLHQNIMLRGQVIDSLRRRMKGQGFFEFQTPILTASSPEGARDFLVPSRLHPGKFYALPQAPQQYKQLLMMAGFDRYFQIAPLLSRRRPARRPPARRILPARHRDELRRAGGRVRRDGAGDPRRVRGVRPRQAGHALALAAHSLFRGDAQIRLGQAGPAQSARHAGRLRAFPRLGFQGVRPVCSRSRKTKSGPFPRPAAVSALSPIA